MTMSIFAIKVLLELESGQHHLITSTIDTLHMIINGYKIECIWNSNNNVHECMFQTNADLIYQKLIVFVSCGLIIA